MSVATKQRLEVSVRWGSGKRGVASSSDDELGQITVPARESGVPGLVIHRPLRWGNANGQSPSVPVIGSTGWKVTHAPSGYSPFSLKHRTLADAKAFAVAIADACDWTQDGPTVRATADRGILSDAWHAAR